ncbi:MAG: STAS domain-containing protein, partial [Candidatus Rokubacteria bacterium]|nr:STAS domain-containing protein [Candidatus Rokubacteria bacterium]
MPFMVERGERGGRLVLSGGVTVADAAALRDTLATLVPLPGAITVDDARLGEYDMSLLQLLVAFARTRAAGGGAMTVTGGAATARLVALGLPLAPVLSGRDPALR